MSEILYGKNVCEAINRTMSEKIAELNKSNITPGLSIVRVGRNESDLSYERTLRNKASKLGISVSVVELAEDCLEDEVCETIMSLNASSTVHGILLFRPLPSHLNEKKLCNLIDPSKDIDCVSEFSLGRVFTGSPLFYPCTSEAVIRMLDHYGVELKGKNVTVLGRSMVVGKPLALMLMERNATVTVCHSRTKDLKLHTSLADIIVSCMGRKEMIDASYIGEGEPVVIDVGVNYDEVKQKITGDVAYEDVFDSVSAITPVPGGVGTVTSTLLLEHVVEAAMNI